MRVWVVHWRYSDGSGSGVVGVYATKELASEVVRAITHAEGARDCVVLELELFGTAASPPV